MIFHGSLRQFSVPDRNRIAMSECSRTASSAISLRKPSGNVNMNMKPREGVGDQMVAGALGNYFMKFGVKDRRRHRAIRIGADGAFSRCTAESGIELRGLLCQWGCPRN